MGKKIDWFLNRILLTLFLLMYVLAYPNDNKKSYSISFSQTYFTVVSGEKSELHFNLDNTGEQELSNINIFVSSDSILKHSIHPNFISLLKPDLSKEIILTVHPPKSIFSKKYEIIVYMDSKQYKTNQKLDLTVKAQTNYWTNIAFILAIIMIFTFILIFVMYQRKES